MDEFREQIESKTEQVESYVKSLRNESKSSRDVIIMFDEDDDMNIRRLKRRQGVKPFPHFEKEEIPDYYRLMVRNSDDFALIPMYLEDNGVRKHAINSLKATGHRSNRFVVMNFNKKKWNERYLQDLEYDYALSTILINSVSVVETKDFKKRISSNLKSRNPT